MLVKFDSPVGTITMFGDAAVQLLQMMGHSGTIPSALLAADIPAAVERLERGLTHLPPPRAPAEGEESDQPAPVGLRLRAFPLIELLKRAAAKQADVVWDRQ